MNDALPPQRVRWHRQADLSTLHQSALTLILAAAAEATGNCGQFRLVLAGGETPRAIYRALRTAEADWPSWHIYFGDERCLPPNDPARNSRLAGEAWLDHVPIPAQQIHTIPAELGPRPAAAAYAATVRDTGAFDLVLLGLGEDGHTASLFPGHGPLPGNEAADVLAVFDAPKPPAQRVSLSAARLSRSRQLVFLIAGEGKRQAVADWRAGKDIPARRIAPPAGVDALIETSLLVDGQDLPRA